MTATDTVTAVSNWMAARAKIAAIVVGVLSAMWGGVTLAITHIPGLWVTPEITAMTASIEEVSKRVDAMDINADVARLAEEIETLREQLVVINKERAGSTEPVLLFAQVGSSISDGKIGGIVEFLWIFYKLRDCGVPILDLLFINGNGLTHRFQNVSITDAGGRGVRYDPDPNRARTIKYTAQIPADAGVKPGRALGWVSLTYPDCPHAPAVTSPRVAFDITE